MSAETIWDDASLVNLVRKHWLEGESATRIAKRIREERSIRVTRNQVIGKVMRLGLNRAPAAELRSLDQGKRDAVHGRHPHLRAPSVKRDLYSATNGRNANKSRPPKPGPQNKPAVVFGATTVLNPAETQAKQDAALAEGLNIQRRFTEPANDTAIPLIQRGRFQCSWPVGEPDRAAGQMCCGLPVREDAPRATPTYCPQHVTKALGSPVRSPAAAKEYVRSMRRFA